MTYAVLNKYLRHHHLGDPKQKKKDHKLVFIQGHIAQASEVRLVEAQPETERSDDNLVDDDDDDENEADENTDSENDDGDELVGAVGEEDEESFAESFAEA